MIQKKEIHCFSFFIWFSMAFALVFVLPVYSRADSESTATLQNSNENYNNPVFGYEINNFGNNKLQKSIAATPPSLIFSSPNTTQPYLGSEKPQVFQGRGYYFPQELYSEKETLNFIKDKKDIIQTFGKLFDVPVEGEPILLLADVPKNHLDLGGVQFTGPPNGSLNETVERAKAYAYYKFGSQKMLVKVSYLNYNMSAVGNSGGNIGTATVQGEFSHNAGLAPSTGVTASTVYRTPVVTINCYSNKPIGNFPSASLNLLKGFKQLIIKNYSTVFSPEQMQTIDFNANLLASQNLTNGASIEILAFSPTGNTKDIEKLEPVVREVMEMIGSRLYKTGHSDEFLDTVIKAKIASIKNPKISQVLKHDNAVAGIVLNVN